MSLYVDGVLDGAALCQKGFAVPYRTTLIIGARGSADQADESTDPDEGSGEIVFPIRKK